MFLFKDSQSTPSMTTTPMIGTLAEKIDLNAFLLNNDKDFRSFLGPTINLRYSLASNTPEILVDKDQFKQLMAIFLSNARKAMPNGGQLLLQTKDVVLPEPDSPFPSGTPAPYLMMAISDTGNGIHTEVQGRIQQLFSGRWRPKGGYFPGLTRAKDILDAHRAKLLFYSQIIRGTTFKIYFPVSGSGERDRVAVPAIPKGTETLLFVEDDPMMRHIYTKYLRQRGYNVLEAEHGKEAFHVYENYAGHIHLMITDVVMPELNGRQLVDLMQMHYPELKVLYISGFTKDAIVQRGILKADMPFLEKPFGREELALRVRQMLDVRTAN
jgi:two-component system cell cycle sensor histidine kinase/response regulator CckA